MQRVNIVSKESSSDEIVLSLPNTLYRHCRRGDSGVIFVTTNENKSCKIFLNKGRVVAINMRKHGGEAAPAQLNRVGVKACSFSNRFKLPYSKSDEISSSDEILTKLGCNLTGLYSLSDIAKQLL